MSETMVTIIVAVITALGSVITALIGWLARKGVNFVDKKIKVLVRTRFLLPGGLFVAIAATVV